MLWMSIVCHIPKHARFTIGARIENTLLDLMETAYQAYYIKGDKKSEKIDVCIYLQDILKFLLDVLWDGRLISNDQYEQLSKKFSEIGRMLGGWQKSLTNPEKKNRTL